MKTLSLKLENEIFFETEEVVKALDKKRNRYINDALSYYNKVQKRKLISGKLRHESRLVRNESISVLKEFEKIDL